MSVGAVVSGVEIMRWAHGGEGIGFFEGKVIFVAGVVPGDVVSVRVVVDKARWARGELVRVERPSVARVEVPCAIQAACGGCPWMVGSEAAQASAREGIVRGELVKRLGEAGRAVPLVMEESPRQLGYRQRVRMRFESDGVEVRLGFLGAGSHRLVEVGVCEIAQGAVNRVLPEVREALRERFWGRAVVGRVTLLAGEDGAVAGWIEAEGEPGVRWGAPDVSVAYGRFRQRMAPDAFAQANPEVVGQLLEIIYKWSSKVNVELRDRRETEPWAIELFAGGGTLTMALWDAGWRVTAYEADQAAFHGFEATRRQAGVPAERGRWFASDLFLGPPWPRPPEAGLVLLDPPRAGAKEATEWVGAAEVPAVIYVSCDLATGLRDVATLVRRGYRVEEIRSFDMFPHTGHQELAILLTRIEAAT